MKKILTSMIAFVALVVSVIGCSTAIDNDPEELAKSKVVEKSMIVQGVSVTGFSKDLNGKKIALIKQTVVKTSDKKDGSDRSVEATMGTGIIADSAKLYKSGTVYIPFFGKDDTLVSNYSYKDFEVPKSVQDKIDANNKTKVKNEDGSIKDEEVVSAVEVRFYLAIGDDLTTPTNKVLIEKTSSTGSMTYEGAQLDVITSKFGTKTADLEKRWLKVIVPEETASNIVGTFEFEKAAKIEEPKIIFYYIGDITEGKFVKMTAKDSTTQTAEFTYDAEKMTAWGGTSSGVNFKMTDSDNWGTVTMNLGATKGDAQKISVGTNAECGGAENLIIKLENAAQYKITLKTDVTPPTVLVEKQ